MSMTVFVTGASAGFGAAVARKFVSEGHRVVAAGRRQERLKALAGELRTDRVCPLELDVRDTPPLVLDLAVLPARADLINVPEQVGWIFINPCCASTLEFLLSVSA